MSSWRIGDSFYSCSERIKNFFLSITDWLRSWGQRKKDEFRRELRKQYLNTEPSKIALNIFLVILGTALLSFNTSIFMVPGNIISGGNSGIGLVFEAVFESCGVSLEGIGGINTVITLITVFFFVLGFFIVGLDFTVKTAISTLVYPAFIYLFDFIRGLNGMDWIRLETYLDQAVTDQYGVVAQAGNAGVILAAGLIGGVIMGLGVSLAFKGGGSTGGTDCIVIALSKKTRMKANTASVLIDSIIILLGICLVRDLVSGCVSILSAIICSVMIKNLFVGSQGVYTANIISAKWREISDAINRDMDRGTTLHLAKGGYTMADRVVVTVSFTRDEYSDLVKLIHEKDAAAFVTILSVSEVQGHGFSLDDGDEPKQLPKKPRKRVSDSYRKAEREAQRADQSKERELRKSIHRVLKEDRREAKGKKRTKDTFQEPQDSDFPDIDVDIDETIDE